MTGPIIATANAFELVDVSEYVIDGLAINFVLADGTRVEVAKVLWDYYNEKPYIRSNGENLQTYVVDFDGYKDFIKLIDEAYFRTNANHKAAPVAEKPQD
jgi:hypothetical protein